MIVKSYKDLEVYKGAFELCIQVHHLTLRLPKQELYELGSQIRRSAQSVRANIVEGYGRRYYPSDFVRFLIQAHASLLETISHLEMINELYHIEGIPELVNRFEKLGSQIFNFANYVRNHWDTSLSQPPKQPKKSKQS